MDCHGGSTDESEQPLGPDNYVFTNQREYSQDWEGIEDDVIPPPKEFFDGADGCDSGVVSDVEDSNYSDAVRLG